MNTGQTRDLPAPLEGVRQRFVVWRGGCKAHARIPDSLWNAAVKMAGTYGVHRTARALRVEYYSLKRRLERQCAASRKTRESRAAAAFVELPPPADHGLGAAGTASQAWSSGACDCTVELEGADGSTMRVHLKAAMPPDLAALCRSFREATP